MKPVLGLAALSLVGLVAGCWTTDNQLCPSGHCGRFNGNTPTFSGPAARQQAQQQQAQQQQTGPTGAAPTGTMPGMGVPTGMTGVGGPTQQSAFKQPTGFVADPGVRPAGGMQGAAMTNAGMQGGQPMNPLSSLGGAQGGVSGEQFNSVPPAPQGTGGASGIPLQPRHGAGPDDAMLRSSPLPPPPPPPAGPLTSGLPGDPPPPIPSMPAATQGVAIGSTVPMSPPRPGGTRSPAPGVDQMPQNGVQ